MKRETQACTQAEIEKFRDSLNKYHGARSVGKPLAAPSALEIEYENYAWKRGWNMSVVTSIARIFNGSTVKEELPAIPTKSLDKCLTHEKNKVNPFRIQLKTAATEQNQVSHTLTFTTDKSFNRALLREHIETLIKKISER